MKLTVEFIDSAANGLSGGFRAISYFDYDCYISHITIERAIIQPAKSTKEH